MFVASKTGEIKASTMKGYLCAVHSWHVDEGVQVDFTPFKRLKRALRGMERLDVATPIKRAAPITMAAVARMASVANMENIDDVTVMAIASLATAGLFRLGELVPYKVKDDPVLLSKRVWVTKEGVWVHLPRSKTDPLGKHPPMFIAKNDGLACPRLWIMRMRAGRKQCPDQPTFLSARSRQVTREWVLKRVNTMMKRAGLGGQSYSGHSFRRGGTTSLAAAGVPDHIISKLGRWKSATYQIYVAASPDRLAAAQRAMAAATCVFGAVGMSSRPSGARHA
jgi:integrase